MLQPGGLQKTHEAVLYMLITKGNRALLVENPDVDYDANRIKQQGG